MLVRPHVQHQIVFVFGLFAADRALELRLDAALEPLVAIEAVRTRVRVAAALAGVRAAQDRARHLHRRAVLHAEGARLQGARASVPVAAARRGHGHRAGRRQARRQLAQTGGRREQA